MITNMVFILLMKIFRMMFFLIIKIFWKKEILL